MYPSTVDPSTPPPPCHCPFKNRKTGIETGFAVLAKSLAYVCKNVAVWGLMLGVHRVEQSKADWKFESKDFMKKKEFVETRKNGVKSC
jgi:hypothetical protein